MFHECQAEEILKEHIYVLHINTLGPLIHT